MTSSLVAAAMPSLPVEVWHRVLGHHNQPDHLWTVCHQVCASWRSEVPKVFAKRSIPNPEMTRVYFSFDGFFDAGTRLEAANVIMEFEGVEKGDKTRCIFVEDANSRDAQGVAAEILYLDNKWEKAFKDHVDAHSNMYHYPLYQIRIKHHILDTELPDLRWDWENRAMSFNWHVMPSAFYRETAEHNRRVGLWVAKHNDALRTAVRAENGDFALTDTVSLGIWAKRLSRAARSHRVKLPRERLLRQHGGRRQGKYMQQWEELAQSRIESRQQEAERLDLEEEQEAVFE